MALTVTTVPRNLGTKVRFLYLEFEDLFFILSLAVVMNVAGRFFHRDIFGIPMNIVLQWIVPTLSIPCLIVFKYGKPKGYLRDWLLFHMKPHVYCALEHDSQQRVEYLRRKRRSECRSLSVNGKNLCASLLYANYFPFATIWTIASCARTAPS
jgi:hypothetical protein